MQERMRDLRLVVRHAREGLRAGRERPGRYGCERTGPPGRAAGTSWGGAAFGIVLLALAGCATQRVTNPERTATEQFLLSKAVTEAVEHVLERTVEHFRETLDGALPENPTLADLGRALWERHWTSGVFYAWLELVVASRTDPVLNEKVREMDLRWSPKFDAACRSVLGRGADGAVWLFFLTLNALSIEKIRSEPGRLDRSLSDLLALAETADRFFWRFSEAALQNKKQGDKNDACDR